MSIGRHPLRSVAYHIDGLLAQSVWPPLYLASRSNLESTRLPSQSMAQKSLVQGMQEIATLFAQGGERVTDATQDVNAHVGSQAARDFLLHEAVRRRRQAAMMAVFDMLLLERLQLLFQLCKLFSQGGIFLSEPFQFFVFRHTATLADLAFSGNLRTPSE
jgi:hypothetical protein